MCDILYVILKVCSFMCDQQLNELGGHFFLSLYK